MDIKYVVIFLFTTFSVVQSGIPGTFFWRPRVGLDLSIPTKDVTITAHKLSEQNVADGYVVAIDGYQVGMTVIALSVGLFSAKTFPHINPLSASFYTNSYRWGLRHLSLIPEWIAGRCGLRDTFKVWRRRFHYPDEFVPKWLRYLFPYVRDKEWKREEMELKLFKKYSETAFGTKVFHKFKSQETQATLEDSDSNSSSSIEK